MEVSATPQVTMKVQTISGETQLRHFGNFLDGHVRMLDNLLAADDSNYYHRNTGKPNHLQCSPVAINFERHERLNLFQLVNTNNKVLNKIVCAFGHLCMEAKRLCGLAEQQQLRFLYIDEDLMKRCANVAAATETQQSLIVRISEHLVFLCSVQYLVQRCLIVCIDIFKQLAAFFADSRIISNNNNNNNNNNSITSIQLHSVFGYIADLATVFVSFDRILKKSNFHENWSVFVKSIDSLHDNIDQFAGEYSENDIGGLRNVLVEMELLFNGDLFRMLMDGLYGCTLNGNAKTAAAFAFHFGAYIRTQMHKIDKYGALVLNDFTESRELIKCNVMCVLYHNVFGKMEASTFARLFEINQKYCGVTLVEHILWHAEVFIEKYVLQAKKSTIAKAQLRYIADAPRIRQEFLRSKFNDYRVTCWTQKLCLRAFAWMLKVRETQQSDRVDVNVDNLTYRCSLILDGIHIMGEMSYTVKMVTNLHIDLNTAMSKTTLANVCRLLEHFRSIRSVYNENLDFFIESVFIVYQHLSYQALSIIQLTMKKFTNRSTSSTSYNERDIDIWSSLQLSEQCMIGPSTVVRILVTRLTLSISDPVKIFSIDHLDKLSRVLSTIEALIDLRTTINKCPDTTFMHWHQSILPNYLKQVLTHTDDTTKFWNIFHSPKSTVNFLSKVSSTSAPLAIGHFKVDVNHMLRTAVLSRICSHIENNLRLFIHSYMHDSSTTAAQIGGTGAVINDTTALIHLNAVQLNDQHFLFKNHIEHYLSKTFYNLTSVSLSDGRTYGEMRSFAKIKYDLNMVDDQLPTATLEQGLDLLDVMRCIADFVSKFVYDMHNQVFIQTTSNNNFLNTVTVGHIVNSLRTHGIGIMNTAINCSYKLLCQKMPLISKFMYTDKVKSALLKAAKHFEDNKERMNQMYSYELGKNVTKTMLKLDSELSLPNFVTLVAQVGNIMGYVRLVRSAGIKYVSNASIFLPSEPTCVSVPLVDMANDLQLTDVTCEAAWNLKVNILNLSKDFVIKPDYFRSFLQAFTDIMRDPKNTHLRHFYISVPSLTILFVDAIVRCKENKHKNSATGDRLVFTDDGFAMGLAYVLIILQQLDAFYALDWFESVRIKYSAEMEQLKQKLTQLTGSYEDEKLRQTLLLSVKRIETFADEFEMLRCNLGSAIRYFQ